MPSIGRALALALVVFALIDPLRASAQDTPPPDVAALLRGCASAPPSPHTPGYEPPEALLQARRSPGHVVPTTETRPEALERTIGRMPPEDPRRAEPLARLAALHEELARSSPARAARHLTRATEAYEEIATSHRSYLVIDEVLFRLAMLRTRRGDAEGARQAFMQLVRDAPMSRFVPYTYLHLAERSYADGALDDARLYYQRVTTLPQVAPWAAALAHYRIAWIARRAQNELDASRAFARLLAHLAANPDTPDAAVIEGHVRREICPP